MCSPANCTRCGKTTWAGCGQHVDQVMRNVPTAQQCTCQDDAPSKPSSSLLSRVFGR